MMLKVALRNLVKRKVYAFINGAAFVLSVPLAWYAVEQWLQDFAYRIEVDPWPFALAGGLAGLVALLTVSFQAVKAALANPVKSLKNE